MSTLVRIFFGSVIMETNYYYAIFKTLRKISCVAYVISTKIQNGTYLSNANNLKQLNMKLKAYFFE